MAKAKAYIMVPHPTVTEISYEMHELIRCKDCVYWQDNNDGYPHKYCKWNHDETPDPDDFCSAGERKE